MAELPSKEELVQLPLRAIVTYAVRCARRIQPRYRLSESDPDTRQRVAAVDWALTVAENIVADRFPKGAGAYAAASLAQNALNAASMDIAAGVFDPPNAAFRALVAAENLLFAQMESARADAAKEASYSAPDTVDAEDAEFIAEHSYAAAAEYLERANIAAYEAATIAVVGNAIANASKADYDRLVKIYSGQRWLGKPIDATENGPLGSLWPDDPPIWYVEGRAWMERLLAESKDSSEGKAGIPPDPGDEPCGDTEVVVEIEIPEGVSEEEFLEQVGKMAEFADDLHRAHGGHGLKIDCIEIFDGASVPEGMPHG